MADKRKKKKGKKKSVRTFVAREPGITAPRRSKPSSRRASGFGSVYNPGAPRDIYATMVNQEAIMRENQRLVAQSRQQQSLIQQQAAANQKQLSEDSWTTSRLLGRIRELEIALKKDTQMAVEENLPEGTKMEDGRVKIDRSEMTVPKRDKSGGFATQTRPRFSEGSNIIGEEYVQGDELNRTLDYNDFTGGVKIDTGDFKDIDDTMGQERVIIARPRDDKGNVIKPETKNPFLRPQEENPFDQFDDVDMQPQAPAPAPAPRARPPVDLDKLWEEYAAGARPPTPAPVPAPAPAPQARPVTLDDIDQLGGSIARETVPERVLQPQLPQKRLSDSDLVRDRPKEKLQKTELIPGFLLNPDPNINQVEQLQYNKELGREMSENLRQQREEARQRAFEIDRINFYKEIKEVKANPTLDQKTKEKIRDEQFEQENNRNSEEFKRLIEESSELARESLDSRKKKEDKKYKPPDNMKDVFAFLDKEDDF